MGKLCSINKTRTENYSLGGTGMLGIGILYNKNVLKHFFILIKKLISGNDPKIFFQTLDKCHFS